MAASLTRSSNPETGSSMGGASAKKRPPTPIENIMSIVAAQSEIAAQPPPARRRSIADLLAPLDKIAAHSPNLVANHDARFEAGGETYDIAALFVRRSQRRRHADPRRHFCRAFTATNRKACGRSIQFIKLLEAKPELAAGYYLSFYPVCNPTGFEDGTRHSRSGKDLNREFWGNSSRTGSPAVAGGTRFTFLSMASFRCTPMTRAMAFTASCAARH